MERLALQQEKDHDLRQKVKMAMLYPAIVLTLMIIVVLGLGMFVLPNLIGVLLSLNVPLPLVTRLLIGFTNLFTQYGKIAIPVMVATIILFIPVSRLTPVRTAIQWVIFRLPGIGRLAREATIARFGVILGGLFQAGVPIIEALHSLVEVTSMVGYRNFYRKLQEHVSLGDSFSTSFAAIKDSQNYLPPSVQQLIITGEKSGSLGKIMLKIAEIYERKSSETAQKLPVILEPILLLVMGGLVGTIAIAIIVPIYGIVGSIH
jgi:type IV pilus assembly protein PilC